MMTPQQEGEDGGEEEEDDIHDPERPACLQHGTVLVDVGTPLASVAALSSIVSKDAQVDVDVTSGEVAAVGVGDPAQFVHAGNQRAHKGKIDE